MDLAKGERCTFNYLGMKCGSMTIQVCELRFCISAGTFVDHVYGLTTHCDII